MGGREGGREPGSISHLSSESLNLSILHPGQQNFLNISQEAQESGRLDLAQSVLEKEIPDSTILGPGTGWDREIGWSDKSNIQIKIFK